MSRTNRRIILVAFMTLNLTVPVNVNAFHGGGHGGGGGGGGFHGGGGGFGGGFHGGGVGGFHGGFVGGAGGVHPGYAGGVGGFRGGYSAPAFNRTPSFTTPHTISSMPRSEVGSFNRFNNVNTFNRNTTFNNNVNSFNRGASFNNAGRLGAVGGINNVNRMGVGWRNPYMGYHQGWYHGAWNGNFGGGWGWRPYGYGYGLGGFGGGFGYGLGWGLGMGLGWGLSSWMFGPMLYNWGYSNYYNPYYAAGGYGYGNGAVLLADQPSIYDYSQPIDPQAAAPDETVVSQATTVFDSARQAFAGGDYTKALQLVDEALKTTPNDATLHEFRALCLFALNRYDEAAAVLYAVLSVGPGWDWTTLISLYGDPETYTQQLRALEHYCSEHTQSAAARFDLGYQYLTQGHAEAAVRQFKYVLSLQPNDQLSAQLVNQIQHTEPSGPATQPAGPAPAPATTDAVAATPASTQPAGTLDGTWTAQPSPDTTITVTFVDKGHFTWKVSRKGKDQSFSGTSSFENGILTLVQEQNNNAMVGNLIWKDPTHMTFKVMGGGSTDPGLSFTKQG